MIDIWLLVADIVIIIGIALMYIEQGTSFSQCRRIMISEDQLKYWRFFLYGTIFTSWLIALLVYVIPSTLRFVLHLFFVIGLNQMLEISVPAYICKKFGYGGTCNCDFYKYNDFYPMIGIGIIGNLLFSFLELNTSNGLLLFGILLLLSLGIATILPQRKLKPLKYPPELLISEIDDLQSYLMSTPHQKKLLTVLDAKCDFCEIQVEEIMRVQEELRLEHLRIYDLTFADEMDPIIPMTLNMNTSEKIPVPTTFIFDSGMAIEQKDGVLSKTEIEAILIQ